ncbi:unnamed protein product [Owenia fusiformis]|uniref:Uncharacterized protein n=1 Tax=Owenia fusiformis TaxID=6347 RepID=A0A8J1YAF9_OWEFU|nr:unnamed protein product [Owenia fusiformis]
MAEYTSIFGGGELSQPIGAPIFSPKRSSKKKRRKLFVETGMFGDGELSQPMETVVFSSNSQAKMQHKSSEDIVSASHNSCQKDSENLHPSSGHQEHEEKTMFKLGKRKHTHSESSGTGKSETSQLKKIEEIHHEGTVDNQSTSTKKHKKKKRSHKRKDKGEEENMSVENIKTGDNMFKDISISNKDDEPSTTGKVKKKKHKKKKQMSVERQLEIKNDTPESDLSIEASGTGKSETSQLKKIEEIHHEGTVDNQSTSTKKHKKKKRSHKRKDKGEEENMSVENIKTGDNMFKDISISNKDDEPSTTGKVKKKKHKKKKQMSVERQLEIKNDTPESDLSIEASGTGKSETSQLKKIEEIHHEGTVDNQSTSTKKHKKKKRSHKRKDKGEEENMSVENIKTGDNMFKDISISNKDDEPSTTGKVKKKKQEINIRKHTEKVNNETKRETEIRIFTPDDVEKAIVSAGDKCDILDVLNNSVLSHRTPKALKVLMKTKPDLFKGHPSKFKNNGPNWWCVKVYYILLS